MATQVGSLYASLTLDSASFVSNMKRAATSAETGADAITKALGIASKAAAGLGALIAVDALAGAVRSAVEFGSSIGETAQQIGFTTKSLQELTYAAGQQGVETETLQTGLSKLTKTLGLAKDGSKAAVEAFGALGISQSDLLDLSPDEAFRKVADAIGKIPDPARRAAAEVAIFGKTGQKLDTLLAGGTAAIDELSASAEKLGLVLTDKQLNNLDALADKGAALHTVFTANLAALIGQNAQSILSIEDAAIRGASGLFKFIRELRGLAPLIDRNGIIAGLTASNAELQRAGTPELRVQDEYAIYLDAKKKLAAAQAAVSAADAKGSSYLRENARQDLADAQKTFDKAKRLATEASAAARDSIGDGPAARTPRMPLDDLPEITITGRRKTPKEKVDTDPLGLRNVEKEGVPILKDVSAQFAQVRGQIVTIEDSTRDLFGIFDKAQVSAPFLAGLQQLDDLMNESHLRAENLATDLSNGLADAVVNSKNLGDVLVNSLKRATAELLSSKLLDLLGGSIGANGKRSGGFVETGIAAVASLFGSGKANGGPIGAGSLHLVGERGPELFAPGMAGSIIPNSALQNMGGSRDHFSLSVSPSPLFDVQLQRVSAATMLKGAPMIAAASQASTIAAIKRIPLPGGRG